MWPTILIGSLVGVIFLAIVIKIKGKPSCGGNCGSCNLCHGEKNTDGQ